MGLWVWSYFMGRNVGVEGKWLEKQLNLGDGKRGIGTAGRGSVQNPRQVWGDEGAPGEGAWGTGRCTPATLAAEALSSSLPWQPRNGHSAGSTANPIPSRALGKAHGIFRSCKKILPSLPVHWEYSKRIKQTPPEIIFFKASQLVIKKIYIFTILITRFHTIN